MRTVQVFVEGVELDLFKDESISVTSTIQNIDDISKVFTDFSQTFTIPTSKTNNSVFSHWYQNDVDNGFVAKSRVAARIEINHIPFRIGKVQLEGAELKNNRPESYKITFFGDVVTIKDKFADYKLSDLDYTSLNALYSGSVVENSIDDTTDLDIRFPLISSGKVWTYNDGGANDIYSASSPLVYSELFPAVKVSKIFEFIESEFSLSFSGLFLDDKRFTNLFTWFKNQKTADFFIQPEQITFDNGFGDMFVDSHLVTQGFNATDAATLEPSGYSIAPVTWSTTNFSEYFTFHHSCNDIGVTYWIDFLLQTPSGVYTWTISQPITTTATNIGAQDPIVLNCPTAGLSYKVQFRCAEVITIFDTDVVHTTRYKYQNDTPLTSPTYVYDEIQTTLGIANTSEPFTLSSYLDIKALAPDIKIADYFTGILNKFNLTCFPLQDGTFQIEPLQDWYSYGGEVDITPHVIDDTIKINRPKLHKSIDFEYEKSKSFLNENFMATYDRQYGSLSEQFDYDGSPLKVKLPFENLMFTNLDLANFQVAYSLTDTEGGADKSYIPKCTNLYLYEEQACDFRFNDGATTTQKTTYMPFGQDVEYNGENYSSNFGLDISSLLLTTVDKSLYGAYYSAYLSNLFDDKTRKVEVSAMMPLSMLTNLTLDDAIIIRDKRYRIDSMKTDLTTGKVDLVLITDLTFIEVDGANDVPVLPTLPDLPINSGGSTIYVPVKPHKPHIQTSPFGGGGTYVKVLATLETQFITTSPTIPVTFTTPTMLTITVPVNSTGAQRTNTIPLEYYDANDVLVLTDYIYVIQDYEHFYLLKEDGKFLLTETYDKIELE